MNGCSLLNIDLQNNSIPIVVVDGTVFVATIGATVAAATGVTVLKIDFCENKNKTRYYFVYVKSDSIPSA